MENISPVVIWAILGIVLIIIETTTVTFVLMFFGAAALVTAFVSIFVDSFAVQVAVFVAASVVLLLSLRKVAKNLFSGHQDLMPDYLGKKVNVVEDIPPGREGKVSFRGSPWIAVSEDSITIPAGSHVEVVAADGIKLKVKRAD